MREKIIEAIVGYLDEIRSERDLRKLMRYAQMMIDKQGSKGKGA